MKHMIVLVIVLMVVLFFTGSAFAENYYYATGIAQFKELDFKNAKQNLENAVDSGELTKDELTKAHEALATIALSEGDENAAIKHFQKILDNDRTYILPTDASPTIKKAFRVAAKNEKILTDGKNKSYVYALLVEGGYNSTPGYNFGISNLFFPGKSDWLVLGLKFSYEHVLIHEDPVLLNMYGYYIPVVFGMMHTFDRLLLGATIEIGYLIPTWSPEDSWADYYGGGNDLEYDYQPYIFGLKAWFGYASQKGMLVGGNLGLIQYPAVTAKGKNMYEDELEVAFDAVNAFLLNAFFGWRW